MSLKHVVIGGGSGFIGSHIVDCLRRKGSICTVISQGSMYDSIPWHAVERIGLPKDTTAVINVAGQNVMDSTQDWDADFRQQVKDSRVKTTKILAQAITETQAKVFVTISGVSYYKPDNATVYTEDSTCEPYDFLSELCHEWEEAARLPPDSSIRQATVRSGVVLGKEGGMIREIYIPFKLGVGGPIGDGKQYMPWIHITDLVNLFLFILKNDNVQGILNGVAPEMITNSEFTKAFAQALWRPAIFPVPKLILNMLYGKERVKMILEGQKVSPKRIQELGFQYEYPDIKSACQEIALHG